MLDFTSFLYFFKNIHIESKLKTYVVLSIFCLFVALKFLLSFTSKPINNCENDE